MAAESDQTKPSRIVIPRDINECELKDYIAKVRLDAPDAVIVYPGAGNAPEGKHDDPGEGPKPVAPHRRIPLQALSAAKRSVRDDGDDGCENHKRRRIEPASGEKPSLTFLPTEREKVEVILDLLGRILGEVRKEMNSD
ncbi:hypothetical protein AURDEDRAFT_177842 [Auricularia subglabra TFB-10046 SS5]|uniref:Uncharacterized protein n=1 Tax=Auricularia subglabra (strain TFB-10046 / SS5) TaxID=717982 RepID=J0L9N0_AURST|nr:hypothetical protein AURDEDRAFT_177842 [Auricularia subglabra TFB-10046 SS5]